MRHAIAIAAICAMPAQAMAAAPPPTIAADLCDFLNKVIAASADAFWTLTNTPRDSAATGNPLPGKFLPLANTRCFVVPAHTDDAKKYAPEYSCELIEFGSYSSVASLSAPEKVFDDTEAKLQGCLAGVRSATRSEGRRGTNAYQRTLSWPRADAMVELRLAVVGASAREPALIAVQLAINTGTAK